MALADFRTLISGDLGKALLHEGILPQGKELCAEMIAKAGATLGAWLAEQGSPGRSMAELFQGALEQLRCVFPGLSIGAIAKGEIPVATQVLEGELRKWADRAQALRGPGEALHLSSEAGAFRLKVRKRKWGMLFDTTVRIVVDDFEFSSSRRQARCQCSGEPEFQAANGLASLFMFLAKPGVRRFLRSEGVRQSLHLQSGGVMDLHWPVAIVDLTRVEPLERMANSRVAGTGLLELLSFGPLRVEQDRVVLGFIRPKT